MNFLLDTNILLRLVEINHPHHKETANALITLRQKSCNFFILLQNISEFWNVCTRPLDKNGLGLSVAETDAHLKKFERLFKLLPDTTETYENWRELVVKHSVSGVKVHDAKLVASMKAHNLKYLLTFNTKDFKRYTDIEAVEPKNI